MFENIKQQIANSLLTKNISNLDEYVYELHEALPNFIVNVPEQESEEFYEFAGKFMQYLLNDADSKIPDDLGYVCNVISVCPDELCYVNAALASMSGEDITDDIIHILSAYNDVQKFNINKVFTNSEDIETLLDSIFNFTNHDWANMVGVTLDWDKVISEVLSVENVEDDPYDYYAKEFNSEKNDLNKLKRRRELGLADTLEEELENNEDDPNFGVDALFSFVCVDGPDSAEQALQLIYNECGWTGHPEDDIKAGVDFPNYGIINQEEADWFNANMNAIFTYYDGDPCEYALICVDPANEIDDEDIQDNYNISSAEVAIKITDALKNNELQVIGNSNGKAIVSFDDVCDVLDIDISSDYYTDSTADAILSATSDKFAVYDADALYQIVNHIDGFTEEDSEGIEQFDEPMSYDDFLSYISNVESTDDIIDSIEADLQEDYDYEITYGEINEYLDEHPEIDIIPDTVYEELQNRGWSISSDQDDDSVTDNVVDGFISNLEDEYPNSEITYDELLDVYNESGISHLISMGTIAEMLDGQGWTITEIPDYAETFKEKFGN